MGLLKSFAAAVRRQFDPLSETKPEIEWVKWVHNDSLVSFMARKAPGAWKSIAKVQSVSGQLFIKTKDGDIYKRYGNDPKRQWCKAEAHSGEDFKSAYLESVIADAMARGLKQQPSAHEIYNSIMGHGGPRWQVMWNGTDEEFARLDDDYPSPPVGFSDIHTPEDFAESAPKFKAYLDRKGYGPFWYDRGYDQSTEPRSKQFSPRTFS